MTTDLPPPIKQRKPDPLVGEREAERLSPGAFFAEHKALVDHKRDHLARLGMDERHVAALRMPERHDAPIEPQREGTIELPAKPPEDAPKRAPKGELFRGDVEG